MNNTGIKKAKFSVGDVVIHQRQGYRAVVIDVDASFQPSGYYHTKASERLGRNHPWYRLLVDESSQETYVEEVLLKRDFNSISVDNPNIENHLTLKQDKYQMIDRKH